ncbi:MAG: ABC transporter permease subunit [Burkholderiales bacterium]|nr:ABC transporter permease subunit [Anaerolineae bacterium]
MATSAEIHPNIPHRRNPLDLLRDIRVIQVIGQIAFTIIIVAFLSILVTSVFNTLQRQNLVPSFAFLDNRAGFDIGDKPEWYTQDSKFIDAFAVGVQNTLRVVSIGLVLTTIIGVFLGIFLLSTNWLVRNISKVFVEIIRNTPLLVQLFVWYFVVMLSLPTFQEPLTIPQEGIAAIPIRLLIYVVLFVGVSRYLRRYDRHSSTRAGIIAGLASALIVIEFAFWLSNNVEGWSNTYGKANFFDASFWLYLIISGLLLGATRFASLLKQNRWAGIGVIVGQLIGWLLFYFGIVPNSAFRLEMQPAIFMSIRGFAFPEVLPTTRFAEWLAFIILGIVIAVGIWVWAGRVTETTGRVIPRFWYALAAIVGGIVLGWIVVGIDPAPANVPVLQEEQIVYMPLEEARASNLLTSADEALISRAPLLFILPERGRFRFDQGTEITPEYMALLIGLVIYTSAFIAEIVRAGIQAVPSGQVEAARAVGLSYSQTLRMIVLPQALRVIIPPLGNQYLNLAKNSSLAIGIAYTDLFAVTTTIMNTSGQSIVGMIIILVVYLTMSLSIATVMNWVNQRFQLVTR